MIVVSSPSKQIKKKRKMLSRWCRQHMKGHDITIPIFNVYVLFHCTTCTSHQQNLIFFNQSLSKAVRKQNNSMLVGHLISLRDHYKINTSITHKGVQRDTDAGHSVCCLRKYQLLSYKESDAVITIKTMAK